MNRRTSNEREWTPMNNGACGWPSSWLDSSVHSFAVDALSTSVQCRVKSLRNSEDPTDSDAKDVRSQALVLFIFTSHLRAPSCLFVGAVSASSQSRSGIRTCSRPFESASIQSRSGTRATVSIHLTFCIFHLAFCISPFPSWRAWRSWRPWRITLGAVLGLPPQPAWPRAGPVINSLARRIMVDGGRGGCVALRRPCGN